jgi:hypothetical protein
MALAPVPVLVLVLVPSRARPSSVVLQLIQR